MVREGCDRDEEGVRTMEGRGEDRWCGVHWCHINALSVQLLPFILLLLPPLPSMPDLVAVCLFVCLSVFLSISLCLTFCLFARLCLSLSIFLSVHLSLSARLSIHLECLCLGLYLLSPHRPISGAEGIAGHMEVLSIVETEHCKRRGGKGIVGDGTAREEEGRG
jgi:hypothetical protein